MTRIFTEGGENGDMMCWTSSNGASNVSGGRISGRAFYMGTSPVAYMSKSLGASYSEFYFRAAFQLEDNTRVPLVRWYNGSTLLGYITRVALSGSPIQYYVGTGTLVKTTTICPTTAEWHTLEIHVKIANSGGIIEAKLDGISLGIFTGDTQPGSETNIDTIYFGQNERVYWDDIAFNDVSGGADNSWCGDSHVYGLTPNANGSASGLTGSDGNSVNNYQLVDDVPANGDTDYVESSVATTKDLYAISDLPTLVTGETIKRLWISARAREASVSGDSIKLVAKSGSTELKSSAMITPSTYTLQEFVMNMETDPNTGSAWTEAAVNALEIGVEIQ